MCSRGEKLSKNIVNTNLEVTNRYPVSSEDVVLDRNPLFHGTVLTINSKEKLWKGSRRNEGAKNYKLHCYQSMEAMSVQRSTINSTLH